MRIEYTEWYQTLSDLNDHLLSKNKGWKLYKLEYRQYDSKYRAIIVFED